MDELKIISLNVNGLGNGLKRRKIYTEIRDSGACVTLLQETHCSRKTESLWTSEWGAKMFCANGSTASCGVAILISNAFQGRVETVVRDIEGRFIAIKLNIDDTSYAIGNVYGHNADRPDFLQECFDHITSMNACYSIIGGDFNVTLSDHLDRDKVVHANDNSRNVINNYLQAEEMVDVWRVQHPTARKFTWHRRLPSFIWSRIDYFLINEALLRNCTSDIKPGICSDHSMISITLTLHSNKKGRGLWKFNCKLLANKEFSEKIKQLCQEIQLDYVNMPPDQRWELFKLEFTRMAKEFSNKKAADQKKYQYDLTRLVSALQNEQLLGNNSQSVEENLNRIQAERDAILEEKTRAAAFRCKIRWYEGGEKASKYFCNLEKRNFSRKTMQKVQLSDGTISQNPDVILDQQERFYTKLYKSDESVNFVLENTSGVVIPQHMATKLDQAISASELYDALMTLKEGKTPGCDGIPLEVYKHFWNHIQPIYTSCCEFNVSQGELNFSAKKGVISPHTKEESWWITSKKLETDHIT